MAPECDRLTPGAGRAKAAAGNAGNSAVGPGHYLTKWRISHSLGYAPGVLVLPIAGWRMLVLS